MSKVSADTQNNILKATSESKVAKSNSKLYLSNINWHWIPLPIPINRNVHTGREDWTKARKTAGQTPNPIALSQTHWTSIPKGIDGALPVTSHTSLSLGTSSPCSISPRQISQCIIFLHNLWSQNATQASTSPLKCKELSQSLPWDPDSVKRWLEWC